LPQLWNILRGQMAWVGPRPIIRSETGRYGTDCPKLQSIRPGLTGLWQVSGRSTLTYPQRVHLDMQYIDQRCFALDAVILLKTVREIFLARGAV
ncbi:MAG: sugar transferase, partial [Oligosphaeraceae bacterium]|nr:sugar transferase [Oligosphaeraceae bacterium]